MCGQLYVGGGGVERCGGRCVGGVVCGELCLWEVCGELCAYLQKQLLR